MAIALNGVAHPDSSRPLRRGPNGRPPKINDRTIESIVGAVRAGSYIEPACRAAGVSVTSFYRWLAIGKAEVEAIEESERSVDTEIEEAMLLLGPEPEPDWVRFPVPWGQAEWLQTDVYLARLAPRPRPKVEIVQSPYRKLWELIDQAEAQAEISAVVPIRSAMINADPKTKVFASLEFLSRKWPDRWAKRDRMEVTGKGGGKIEIAVDISADGPAADISPDVAVQDAEILSSAAE